MPTRLINADEQQRASLTLRLNAPQVPLPNTGEQPFLNRPLRGLVRGRDVRSPWRNVSGAFVACRNLDSSSPSAKRHPRSGATPSPFRRNGTPVSAKRHRRSGATPSPFRREEEEKAYTPHCPPLHHPGRTPVDDKKGGPLARAAPTYNKHERKRCCVKPADGSAADLTSPHLRGASARSSAPGEP